MTDTSYPVPGRGTWTRAGGLLPGRVGATTRAGYYRVAGVGETPIGAAYALGADRSHDPYMAYLAVRAIQRLVGFTGTQVDGVFAAPTGKAVIAAQKRWGVEADGIVGRTTMKAGLTPLIREIAVHNDVPLPILGGLLVNESALDPAAVGVNGADHGIAQINLAAHGATVSLEMAMEPGYATMFSAQDLAQVHATWVGKTKADPWDVAIANHNSPALARRWAQSGLPPFVPGRLFQIEDYVARVREAW